MDIKYNFKESLILRVVTTKPEKEWHESNIENSSKLVSTIRKHVRIVYRSVDFLFLSHRYDLIIQIVFKKISFNVFSLDLGIEKKI